MYFAATMFELLYQKITEKIEITAEEFEFVKTLFITKKIRRRQYLLQEGDVGKYSAFVEKGMLRSYTLDEKGGEHILQFAPEGWWLADLDSFVNSSPSIFNMDALEDSELLLITKPSYDQLLQKIPLFERYFRILLQNNLIATQRRLIGSLSLTAEERYARFMSLYTGCMERVPQHMIASYLGITRETLSRIRKQMALSK